jgi:hypothetical protein
MRCQRLPVGLIGVVGGMSKKGHRNIYIVLVFGLLPRLCPKTCDNPFIDTCSM